MAQEIYHRSEWGNPNEQWGNVYLNADLTNELYKRASEYENSWVTDQLLNGVGIKPSIILTPTAYEDGILNSVKPAKTLGSELVTNGDFATDLSGWTNSNNHWQWTSQGAYFPLISTHNPLTQILTNPVGVKLKITFTLNIIQGTANVYYNNTSNLTVAERYTESGTYTIETELVKQNTDINFSRYGGINTEFYLDNVSVKEVTEADFDFTRGSSATRVNEKGLIQDVQILSGNLVQNGDFSQIGNELIPDGNFTNQAAVDYWQIAATGGVKRATKSLENGFMRLTYDIANGSALFKSGIVTSGKSYKVTFIAKGTANSNFNSIGDNFNIPSNPQYVVSNPTLTDDWQNYEFYVPVSSTVFRLYLTSAQIGDTLDITNLSVKEVGQNWSFGTGWSMGDGKAIKTSGTGSYLGQTVPTTTIGKKYKFTFDTIVTGGAANATLYGVTIPVFSTSGSQEHTIIATSTTGFNFFGSSSFEGSIDNISLIEVTDDTDLPRINYTNFDYEDGEVVPYSGEGSLLLEPQSTNLIPYSEDFSHSSWIKNDVTIQSGYIAPDGTNSAYKVTKIGSNAHLVNIITGGHTATKSIFAKTTSGTGTIILFNNVTTYFTITEEWQRFDIQHNGSDFFYAADFRGFSTLTEIIIWGAQSEALSYPTSYIKSNSGSAVTRLADACNNSGSSDLINSTEGVLYAEISVLDTSNIFDFGLYGNTSTNQCRIGFFNDDVYASLYNGSYQAQMSAPNNLSDFTKIAFKFSENDFALWIDGNEVATDTSGTTFNSGDLVKLNLSAQNGTSSLVTGNVKCVAVFKEALSDTELQKLTQV